MTYDNMCYWLQGFLEIANPKEITKDQLTIIRNHLNLTMKNMDDLPKYKLYSSPPPPGKRR